MKKAIIWAIFIPFILYVGLNIWTLASSFLEAPRLGKAEIEEVLDENIDGEFEIDSIDSLHESGEFVVVYDIKNDECSYHRAWINTNKEITKTFLINVNKHRNTFIIRMI